MRRKICQRRIIKKLEKPEQRNQCGRLAPWLPATLGLPNLNENPFLGPFPSFEPSSLYDFLKIWFSENEIYRSLTTSWLRRWNHEFVIGHLEIINRPTKKAYLLPNRSRNRHDRWSRPTNSNQCLKLHDHLTTIDMRNPLAIKASYIAVEFQKTRHEPQLFKHFGGHLMRLMTHSYDKWMWLITHCHG